MYRPYVILSFVEGPNHFKKVVRLTPKNYIGEGDSKRRRTIKEVWNEIHEVDQKIEAFRHDNKLEHNHDADEKSMKNKEKLKKNLRKFLNLF